LSADLKNVGWHEQARRKSCNS